MAILVRRKAALFLTAIAFLVVPHPTGVALAQKGAMQASIACQVASVHDGDTFRCRDGTRIRLAAIDAPEMPGACKPGRHCTTGDPYRSRDYLSRLIVGRILVCSPTGQSYSRVVATCSAGATDLSCAMLQAGAAVRMAGFDRANRLVPCLRR